MGFDEGNTKDSEKGERKRNKGILEQEQKKTERT
jgi:hypothetical protein